MSRQVQSARCPAGRLCALAAAVFTWLLAPLDARAQSAEPAPVAPVEITASASDPSAPPAVAPARETPAPLALPPVALEGDAPSVRRTPLRAAGLAGGETVTNADRSVLRTPSADTPTRRLAGPDVVYYPRDPLLVPRPGAAAAYPPRNDAGRRAARITLATLLGYGIALPGMLPPALIALATCSDGTCVDAMVIGGAVAVSLGALAGVHIVGRAMGGNARFLPTALGALLGGALGTALIFAARNPGYDPLAFFPALLLPVFGSVVSFEFDSRTWRDERADARPLRW